MAIGGLKGTAIQAFLAALVLGCAADYQEVADSLPWRWSEKKACLGYCISNRLRDYEVRIVESNDLFTPFNICVFDGDRMLFSWRGHGESVFARKGKTLFVAHFHPVGSGCSVAAVDLASGSQFWKQHLKGIGPNWNWHGYSEYSNQVNIDTDGKVVVVRERKRAADTWSFWTSRRERSSDTGSTRTATDWQPSRHVLGQLPSGTAYGRG